MASSQARAAPSMGGGEGGEMKSGEGSASKCGVEWEEGVGGENQAGKGEAKQRTSKGGK